MLGGASVLVQGVQFKVDCECPTSIASLDDGKCSEFPTSTTSQSPITGNTTTTTTDNTAATTTDKTTAIIRGVVVAIVLIIAVLAFSYDSASFGQCRRVVVKETCLSKRLMSI